MAISTFEVTSYSIKLGHKLQVSYGGLTIKYWGVVTCKGAGTGADSRGIQAFFLSDDSPVPEPTTILDGKWAPVFLPKELLPTWVDMVRNEKPLYGYINTEQPGWTRVSTDYEPVGEGEGV